MKKKLPEITPPFDIDHLVPGQSVDCVLLGFEEEQIKILV